ncbi:MAG: DUF2079 domain-containing protein [Clostridia bacterium]|nr:DUF2079 domain-containing protein [Clostridia bacterium]
MRLNDNRILSPLSRIRPAAAMAALFSAWCLVCAAFACGEDLFTKLNYAGRIPMARMVAAVLLLTAALLCLSLWRARWFYRLLPLCPLLYGAVCAFRAPSFYTAFGFLVPVSILLIYVLREDRAAFDGARMPRWVAIGLPALFGALMAAYLITAALMRYGTYHSPCYDFGIFCQMFHNMRTVGLPLTTCERTVEMSHFAVHLSPFYYLLLPFYALIPRPETLLVLQVLGVLSGVIPLCLLARHFSLTRAQTVAVSLLYLGCAALTGGIFYDFHENKFLTALLLWLFLALERKKWIPVALFTVLTLTVKEDAALYIIFIGIWLLLSRPEKKTGAAMTLGGTGYFLAATAYLSRHGDGAMFNRFSNVIGETGGIADLVHAALANPALLLRECLTEDKLVFAACLLLPLGLIPLLPRKLSSLMLLCPFVVINLLSDYTYQHSLNFQYTYGVMALLFYLTVANLPHIPDLASGFRLRRALLCFALCACALVGAVQVRNHSAVFTNFAAYREDSRVITEVLETLPEDASVRTASMFAAHLADRRELYYLTNDADADYVLLDLRPYINISSARGYEVEYFERRGYELLTEVEDVIAVLKKAE